MRHGEMLLLYTDGVIEARCEGELYGEERLVRLVRGAGAILPSELPRRILKEISRSCEGGMKDDIAILAITLTDRPLL